MDSAALIQPRLPLFISICVCVVSGGPVVSRSVVNLMEDVVFKSSSYNFSLPENQPAGSMVGKVLASSGTALYDVSYTLKTHTDLFSISTSGAIQTNKQLDKEKQEWYILYVVAVDTRSPPTSAFAMATVQVTDVNEPPQFLSELYKASVFSITPNKTPVIQVKASDPDVGDECQLVYSLSADSPYFDVDSSSGLVFVVSAVELAGRVSVIEVKATDPRGLHAAAKVEVTVGADASSSDLVLMSLNQPSNAAEEKVPKFEQKGQSQSEAVMTELAKLFGANLQFDVEFGRQSSDSGPPTARSAVIALAVLLALSMLGLIGAVVVIARFKTMMKGQDSESLEVPVPF